MLQLTVDYVHSSADHAVSVTINTQEETANNKATVYGSARRCHPERRPLRKQQSAECRGDTG